VGGGGGGVGSNSNSQSGQGAVIICVASLGFSFVRHGYEIPCLVTIMNCSLKEGMSARTPVRRGRDSIEYISRVTH